MKLRLRYGLGALVAIWLGYSFVEGQRERMIVLVAAMVIALWTAFSLDIKPRSETEKETLYIEDDDPEDSEEGR